MNVSQIINNMEINFIFSLTPDNLATIPIGNMISRSVCIILCLFLCLCVYYKYAYINVIALDTYAFEIINIIPIFTAM